MNRLVDTFTGSGGLDAHVADTGQTYRGTQIFSGGLNGAGQYAVGCCSFNRKEARADGVINDNVVFAVEINRGGADYLGGIIFRAEAGGLGDDSGRGYMHFWYRRGGPTYVLMNFVQRTAANAIVQGDDAPPAGIGVLWDDNTVKRMRVELSGNHLLCFLADAGGANEAQVLDITLTTPWNDANHRFYGWISADSGGTLVDSLLVADMVAPETHLQAAPSALTFESYDEVQPAPQDVALSATGAPITGLTVVQLDGDVPLGFHLSAGATPAVLTITPDVVGEGLNPGVYPCHVQVDGDNAEEPLSILVAVQVDSPWIEGRPDASLSSWQAVP